MSDTNGTNGTSEEPGVNDVSLVGPDGGETIHLGPTQMRILEDGSTTGHRIGIGEITVAPHTQGPPQHRHAQHDEGSSPAPCTSPSATRPTSPRPAASR